MSEYEKYLVSVMGELSEDQIVEKVIFQFSQMIFTIEHILEHSPGRSAVIDLLHQARQRALNELNKSTAFTIL